MGITGVYQVVIVQFEDSYNMELHIKENKFDVIASLKSGVLTTSLFNGRTTISPAETESHNFIFYNAQIDNYVNVTPPGQTDPINLTPPGGYHTGGVIFAGTVLNGELTGTVVLKNGLACSMRSNRIEGEPAVNTRFRTDGLVGVNRYCTCGTGSCTHHGFCDSCQIFESLHSSTFKGSGFPVPLCMTAQYEKLFGKIERTPLPPTVNNKPRPEHGPHHLVE